MSDYVLRTRTIRHCPHCGADDLANVLKSTGKEKAVEFCSVCGEPIQEIDPADRQRLEDARRKQ